MMKKKFIKNYIILPMAFTTLFVVYCIADVVANDHLSDALQVKIENATEVVTDPLAIIPQLKPAIAQ